MTKHGRRSFIQKVGVDNIDENQAVTLLPGQCDGGILRAVACLAPRVAQSILPMKLLLGTRVVRWLFRKAIAGFTR